MKRISLAFPAAVLPTLSAAPHAATLGVSMALLDDNGFDLYEDDGVSLACDKGEYATTALRYATTGNGLHHLVIEPSQGAFQGQLPARSYELHIRAPDKPGSIFIDGKDLGPGTWDAVQATAIVALPKRGIRDRIEVTWR